MLGDETCEGPQTLLALAGAGCCAQIESFQTTPVSLSPAVCVSTTVLGCRLLRAFYDLLRCLERHTNYLS